MPISGTTRDVLDDVLVRTIAKGQKNREWVESQGGKIKGFSKDVKEGAYHRVSTLGRQMKSIRDGAKFARYRIMCCRSRYKVIRL
jgi:hypothetical protein